jgi:maltooligosyltrehalose trehalohydrolase
LDLGANVVPEGVSFRLWAPAAKRVDVVGINAGFELPMQHSDDDTWHARVDVKPGFQYRYRLDGGEAYPDPYSRFQPEGVHGPSEVMDTASFEWHDADWPGLDPAELVIYELHVGTFTPEGKFEGVIGKLPYL